MRHPLCIGILHDLAAKTELDCKLLRVFDEFLRYDKRTQRCEGVMGFSEQPVRAMPTVASAAAVGHVVLQGIAENMLRRSFHRHTTSRTSDDNIQLTFPIDARGHWELESLRRRRSLPKSAWGTDMGSAAYRQACAPRYRGWIWADPSASPRHRDEPAFQRRAHDSSPPH